MDMGCDWNRPGSLGADRGGAGVDTLEVFVNAEKTKTSLRFQDKCCGTCKFYRIHKTGCYSSECLLLGRTLGVTNNANDHFDWGRGRLCDGWKKRPRTWRIHSEGVEKNPYWLDPYLTRKYLQRLRRE